MNNIALDSFLKLAKDSYNKLKLNIWIYKYSIMLPLVLIFGLGLIQFGIKSRIVLEIVIGLICILVFVGLLIWHIKTVLDRKSRLSFTLVKIADLIDFYKKDNKKIKKDLVFYLKYLSKFFSQESKSFFEKNSIFYEKCENLAKRVNYSLQNNSLNRYNASKIKELAWKIFNEDKVYTKI